MAPKDISYLTSQTHIDNKTGGGKPFLHVSVLDLQTPQAMYMRYAIEGRISLQFHNLSTESRSQVSYLQP
jgi:hypothetical protein